MTNYNDGKWHVWNGGECPVHPQSEVQVRLCDPSAEYCSMVDFAGGWDWTCRGEDAIVSFRVTKPYVEPKKPIEWCINPQGKSIWYDARDGMIHVREVV